MQSNFGRSLKLVLQHEGGYVNHPKDPGGATNRGIIQRTYDAYRKGRNLTPRSVKHLTEAELHDIYKKQYWAAVQADLLPLGLDYAVFDAAVNSGPKQAIKWLQRSLPGYQGRIDGIIGLATLTAVDEVNDLESLLDLYCARRMLFLKSLKTWKTFGRGWTSRVNGVEANAKAMAGDMTPLMAMPREVGPAKAVIEDAKAAPSAAIGDAATGGGIVGGVLTQATEQLSPLGSIDFVATTVAILTVASVVVTVGGLVYRWYAMRRTAKLNDALDRVPA